MATTRARPVLALLAGMMGLVGCSDYKIVTFDGDDVFYQLDASEVDVLLVIDNSCSMERY